MSSFLTHISKSHTYIRMSFLTITESTELIVEIGLDIVLLQKELQVPLVAGEHELVLIAPWKPFNWINHPGNPLPNFTHNVFISEIGCSVIRIGCKKKVPVNSSPVVSKVTCPTQDNKLFQLRSSGMCSPRHHTSTMGSSSHDAER